MQETTEDIFIEPNAKSEKVSDLYQPGAFWKEALDSILKIYLEKGIKGFSSNPAYSTIFVYDLSKD